MVKEVYSLGEYCFYSAKSLAEFKTRFPYSWESVKDKPLKLSGVFLTYDDFPDYLDSLENQPNICLTYNFDDYHGYGFYTTLWCNGLRVHGIFSYYENSIYELLDEIDQFISKSKWAGMKIRTKAQKKNPLYSCSYAARGRVKSEPNHAIKGDF